jgi:hypothetical protein
MQSLSALPLSQLLMSARNYSGDTSLPVGYAHAPPVGYSVVGYAPSAQDTSGLQSYQTHQQAIQYLTQAHQQPHSVAMPVPMRAPTPSQPPTDTLFVTNISAGIASDAVERAFETCPGFKDCRVRTDRAGATVAFVYFLTVAAAATARSALDGLLQLRPQDAAVRIEFASSSTAEGPSSKRPRGEDDAAARASSPPRLQQKPASDERDDDSAAAAGKSVSLFVTGVPPGVTERELAHIFRPFRGFRDVRILLVNKNSAGASLHGRFHNVFVDFDRSQDAAVAMRTLQGYVFDLRARDGDYLQIEYARPPRRPNA